MRSVSLILHVLLVLQFFHNKKVNRQSSHSLDCSCSITSANDYFAPNHCRQYHRCTYTPIPYISPPLETAQYLLFHNISLIRYGDSEVLLARGFNETFQYSDRDLSIALTTIFQSDPEKIGIALCDTFSGFPNMRQHQTNWWIDHQKPYRDWVMKHGNLSRQYFSAIISSNFARHHGTYCALLPQIYQTLRRIWMGKDLVILKGDNNQVFKYDVYDSARSQKIILAPRYHAFAAYRNLKQQLFAEDPSKLFILTAGPVSRVLAYDLAMAGRRALDLGHLAKDYDLFKQNIIPNDRTFYERDENPPPYSQL